MSNLESHYRPSNLSDKVALSFTKFLRFIADTFFKKRYGHRAVVLEMHLMTFIHIAKPTFIERIVIMIAQFIFIITYAIIYLVSQRTAHRIVGYFEEEAVRSYTEYLHELETGKIKDQPAPEVAINYWNLPLHATLKDVVKVIRDDEAGHRDVNHSFADVIDERKTKQKVNTTKKEITTKENLKGNYE